MNQVYIYDGYFEKGEGGWPLIRAAAARYGAETGLATDFASTEIVRTEKGKPFFVHLPVDFSLSHSDMMWMCLFSDKPCGLDVERVDRHRDWAAIARRCYTPDEQHYVELWGEEGFYEIWVRKEAFGKCTGDGIFGKMPSMVDEQADLKDVLDIDGTIYQMQSIEISPEVKCAACIAAGAPEKELIELRIIG